MTKIVRISASAGSGKTYTLTRRFLDLLHGATDAVPDAGCSLGAPPGRGYALAEILAATFTNKAAAEMKDRVVSTLKTAALAEISSGLLSGEKVPSASVWVKRILRHYGSLNIRTIDSLLVTLTRLSALDLDLPPDFEPCFDPGQYFTPHYDALMDDLRTETREEFSPLFLTGSPDTLRRRLEEACAALITLRDFKGFTPGAHLHDALLHLVRRLLAGKETPVMEPERIHAVLHLLCAELRDAGGDLLHALEREQLSCHKNFLAFAGACAACTPYQDPPGGAYAEKNHVDDCLTKASKGLASPETQRLYEQLKTTRRAFAHALPLFKHALQLAPLSALAHELYQRMETSPSAGKLVPDVRIPVLARQALAGDSGVSDALCRLGARLSHLLLDEFQDTSREQWEAIVPLAEECLSTGGSLTYVGDVKQAIYNWRGGDAALFSEAAKDPRLSPIAPAPLYETLKENWRSHPAIVAHNNAVFSLLGEESMARRVMEAMLPSHTPPGEVDRAARLCAAMFADARQNIPPERMQEARETKEALVRLYTVDGKNTAEVESVLKARLERLFLEELAPRHPLGHVAVLVRSGDEALAVTDWLTEWGLPVVTENSFLLSANPMVSRLVSFLTFLDYPLDDPAFWEFITGPECFGLASGLEPDVFSEWLAGLTIKQAAPRPPLFLLFRTAFPDAWASFIAPFHSQAGLMSAYDLLREIIRRFALLERRPEQAPFLRRFLEIAHAAESQGHTSLAAFLGYWKSLAGDERLPLPESMDAVRVMTIHKAKGLEFPVVVLPFHHRGKGHTPELTAFSCHGVPILTRAAKEVPDVYYPAAITHALERLNLLYVAWTRPKTQLHSFITRPESSLRVPGLAKGLVPLLDRFAETAGHECQWEHLSAHELSRYAEVRRTAGGLPVPVNAPSATATAVPEPGQSWRPMEWLPRLKIYRSTLQDAAFTPARRGILAHLCLEHLHLTGPADDPLRNIEDDTERAVRQALRLFPHPLAEPDAVAASMRENLLWFTSLEDAPAWLSRGRREQSLMDEAGKIYRVDLVVEDDTRGLKVIDYKTGSPAPHEEEYRDQVRHYMRLLTRARGVPAQGLLVHLDERRLEEVRP